MSLECLLMLNLLWMFRLFFGFNLKLLKTSLALMTFWRLTAICQILKSLLDSRKSPRTLVEYQHLLLSHMNDSADNEALFGRSSVVCSWADNPAVGNLNSQKMLTATLKLQRPEFLIRLASKLWILTELIQRRNRFCRALFDLNELSLTSHEVKLDFRKAVVFLEEHTLWKFRRQLTS